MLYKCLKCDHETAAGCLPTASCGLYFFGLMGLAGAVLVSALLLVRQTFPHTPQADTPDGETPWWEWAVVVALVPVVLLLVVAGAWALDFTFRTVERFTVRRVKCPECGSRSWSKGYTRGFGT